MVDLFNIVAKPSFWESLALDPLMLMEQRQFGADTHLTQAIHRLAQDTNGHKVMVCTQTPRPRSHLWME